MIKKCLLVIFAIFLLFSLISKVGAIEYAPLIGPGMMNDPDNPGNKIYLPPVKLYPASLTPGVETIVYAFLGSEGTSEDPPISIDYGQGGGQNTIKLFWRYKKYILDEKKYEDNWEGGNDWDSASLTLMLPMYDPALGPPNINPALSFDVPETPVENLDYAQKMRIFVGKIPSLPPYAKFEYRIEAKDTAGALLVEGRTRPSSFIGSSKVGEDPDDPNFPGGPLTNKWNFIVEDGELDVVDLCSPPTSAASWYQGCHQGDEHHPYPTNACWWNLHTGEKVDATKCTACEDDCDKCLAENSEKCAGSTCDAPCVNTCEEACEKGCEGCEERCACCHPDPGGEDPQASGEEGTAQVWVYGCNDFKTTPCQKSCSMYCLEQCGDNPVCFDNCINGNKEEGIPACVENAAAGCHRLGGCYGGRITNNWRGKKEGASHIAALEIPGGLDYTDITVAANENRFYMKAKFRDIPDQDIGQMNICDVLDMFGDLLDNKVLYAYLWLIKVKNPDGGEGYIMYLPLLYDIINNAFKIITNGGLDWCVVQFLIDHPDALNVITGFMNTGGGCEQEPEDPGGGGEPSGNEQASTASNPLMLLSESRVHLFPNLLVLTKLMNPTLTPEQAAEFTPCGNAYIDEVDKSLSMSFETTRNPWKKIIGPNPSGNLLISAQSAAIGIIMTEPYLAALVLGVDITGTLSRQDPALNEDVFTVGRFYRRKPSSTLVQPDFVAPGKPGNVVATPAAPNAGDDITITWPHPTLNSDGTEIKGDPGFKIDFDPDTGKGGYNIYRRHAKPGSATWSGWKWLNEDRDGLWEWKYGSGEENFRTPKDDNLYFSSDPKQAGANRPYINKGKVDDLLNSSSATCAIWYKDTTWQKGSANCSATSFVDIALANSDDEEDRHLAGYSYQYKIVACDFPNPTNPNNTGANQYLSYYKYYDPLIPQNDDADPTNNIAQLNFPPFGGKVDTIPPYNQGPSALSNTVTIAGGTPPPPPQGGGDINEDGNVTLADFSLLAKAYGCREGDTNWNPKCDLNGDGIVNLTDFGILVKGYNE